MRIRIHENQPVAGSRLRAFVARARDLVHRLENHHRAGVPGQFGGAVGGIIVANDEFGFPAALMKGRKSIFDVTEGFAEASFFIERWNDDGDFQSRQIRHKNFMYIYYAILTKQNSAPNWEKGTEGKGPRSTPDKESLSRVRGRG